MMQEFKKLKIHFRDDSDCPPEIFKQIQGMEMDMVHSKSYVNKYVSKEFKFTHEGELCKGIIIGWVQRTDTWGEGPRMESPSMTKSYFDQHRNRDGSALDFWIEYDFVDNLKEEIKNEIQNLMEQINVLKDQLFELEKT